MRVAMYSTLLQSCSGAVVPCTVAFAPSADSAPIVPTMKYWNTFGPVSPPLFLYAAKDGILVDSAEALKGLSNDDEALRVCRAVQPARTAGIWWAVHERASARVVLARAGIVDAGADGGLLGGGRGCEVVDVEVLAGLQLPPAALSNKRFARPYWSYW